MNYIKRFQQMILEHLLIIHYRIKTLVMLWFNIQVLVSLSLINVPFIFLPLDNQALFIFMNPYRMKISSFLLSVMLKHCTIDICMIIIVCNRMFLMISLIISSMAMIWYSTVFPVLSNTILSCYLWGDLYKSRNSITSHMVVQPRPSWTEVSRILEKRYL